MQNILSKHCFSQCFYNVPLQKHGNLQCFHCSGIQKLFRPSLFARFFFTFRPFLRCRKPTQVTQISFQYILKLRRPKIVEKSRKHHQDLDSVRNLESPPPAKADIATAILTNVIEHFVLLMPPNKHAFTAKAVWADFVDLDFKQCPDHCHFHSFHSTRAHDGAETATE